MRYSIVPLVATTIFTLTSASGSVPSGCTHKDNWGNAVVENKCSVPIYYILDNQPDKGTISPGSKYSVPIYEKNADKGGMSIKLFKKKDTDIWSVPAITQFEITATDMQYFDISNVNSNIGGGVNGNGEACDKEPPFKDDGMRMSTPDGKDVTCNAGDNPCKTAYSKNNDDFATAATALGNDITLTICPLTGGSSNSGASNKDASSPSSSQPSASQSSPASQSSSSQQQQSTPPPVEKKVKVDPTKDEQKKPVDKAAAQEAEVAWVTHVVTADAVRETVYVNAPDDSKKEKRHDHMHQHIHNKINKRRHGA